MYIYMYIPTLFWIVYTYIYIHTDDLLDGRHRRAVRGADAQQEVDVPGFERWRFGA